MTEALFTTIALLWTFGCLAAFVMAAQIPHRCNHRACPHSARKEKE